jgi:hypothetical protein
VCTLPTCLQEAVFIAEEAGKLVSSLRDRIVSSGALSNPLPHISPQLPFPHLTAHLPGWAARSVHTLHARLSGLLPAHTLLPFLRTTPHPDEAIISPSTLQHEDTTLSTAGSSPDVSTEAAKVAGQQSGVAELNTQKDATVLMSSDGVMSVAGAIEGSAPGVQGTAAVSVVAITATATPNDTVTVVRADVRTTEAGVAQGGEPEDAPEGESISASGSSLEGDHLTVSPTRLLNLAGAAVNLGYQLGAAEVRVP